MITSNGTSPMALYTSATTSFPTSVVDVLGQFLFQPALASTDWSTLKMIAKGNQFWFFVNATYLGNVMHAGSSSGSVSFVRYTFDTSHSQSIEITDLTGRALQTSAAAVGNTGALSASPALDMRWTSPEIRALPTGAPNSVTVPLLRQDSQRRAGGIERENDPLE